MTEFKIIDTGYGNVDADGSQVTASARAGFNGTSSVYPFTFNLKNDVINGGGSITSEEEIRLDGTLSKVSPVTYKNPVLILQCEVDRSDATLTSSNYQYSWIYQLLRLEQTKGVKVLYITGTSDRLKTLTELYGYRYQSEEGFTTFLKGVEGTSTAYPYIPGYVKNVSNINANAGTDKITFSITFIVGG